MPRTYEKDTCKPIFKMSKDQFNSLNNAIPLTKLIDENTPPVLATDYTLITDNRVGHCMGWDEVKILVQTVDAARRIGHSFNDIIKINECERKTSYKPKFIEIILPKMEDIRDGDTTGYFVLVAEDKQSVIIPKYLDFMLSKLPKVEIKGINIILRHYTYTSIIGQVQIRRFNKKTGRIFTTICQ